MFKILNYPISFVANIMLIVSTSSTSTYPLTVIEYQYYGEFIQSYFNGSSSIPIVLNPISMAIKISKQQTFKKFYNGVLFRGIFNIFEMLSIQCLNLLNRNTCYFEY